MYMCVPDKSAKITKRTATQDIPKIAAKRKRRYELPGSIQKCVVFKKKMWKLYNSSSGSNKETDSAVCHVETDSDCWPACMVKNGEFLSASLYFSKRGAY